MGLNTRFEVVSEANASEITITWTANEPTASTTQTIADGDSPTVAETGQFIQNMTTEFNKLVAEVEELRAAMNAGEHV